jgi:hypothetical protein
MCSVYWNVLSNVGSEGQGRKENACGEGSSGEGEEEEEAEE